MLLSCPDSLSGFFFALLGVYLFPFTSATKLHFFLGVFLHFITGDDSVLPFEGQADRWSDSARERYHAILKQADFVEYVSREYYDGCMLARNRRLVDRAGILLAVYNGERRGGTAATVRYAQKMGREIIMIDPLARI